MELPGLIVIGPTDNPFVPVSIVYPTDVVVSLVSTLFTTDFSDGYVTNTSLVPTENVTLLPLLLDDSTVSRDNVVPEAV
jgi:hypothetical protein